MYKCTVQRANNALHSSSMYKNVVHINKTGCTSYDKETGCICTSCGKQLYNFFFKSEGKQTMANTSKLWQIMANLSSYTLLGLFSLLVECWVGCMANMS